MTIRSKPLVSVIVTTFNVKDYIERCLTDIVSQTYKNLEIIVVDDGSTDGTKNLLIDFSTRDPRIKLFLLEKNSPGGVAHPANIGLSNFSGDYVCFADGDDLFSNDYVERLVSVAIKEETDLVVCDFLEYDNCSAMTSAPYDPFWYQLCSTKIKKMSIQDRKEMLKLNPVPWRKLYRGQFLRQNALLFKECNYFYEDNSFHWFNILSAQKVAFIFDKLVWHRVNRKGQTMSASPQMMLGLLYQHTVIVEYLKRRGDWPTYKSDALEWLVTSVGYLMEILSHDMYKAFFDTLRREISNYNKNEIQDVFQRNFYDLKIQNLFYALITNNLKIFNSTLENVLQISLSQRVQKNYIFLGKRKLFVKSILWIKQKIWTHIKHETNSSSGVKELLEENLRHMQFNTKLEVLSKIVKGDS